MRSLCDKIEDYMRSPLQIDAEKTLLKKLSIGAVRTMSSWDAIIQELWPSSAVEHLPIWPDLASLSLVGEKRVCLSACISCVFLNTRGAFNMGKVLLILDIAS